MPIDYLEVIIDSNTLGTKIGVNDDNNMLEVAGGIGKFLLNSRFLSML
ncbi:MAG TPA: hypothetical protein VF233_10275 [Nitrososphaeraceae archaeon]